MPPMLFCSYLTKSNFDYSSTLYHHYSCQAFVEMMIELLLKLLFSKLMILIAKTKKLHGCSKFVAMTTYIYYI